jgi:hypothetical protein
MLTRGLAQDHVVVYETPSRSIRTDAPSLVRLPSGRLLSSFVLINADKEKGQQPFPEGREMWTELFRSADGGRTWEHLDKLDLDDGLPFVHGGKLYFLCNRQRRRDILITCSTDEGATWAPAVKLFDGSFWNTAAGYAIVGGRLYFAFGQANTEGFFNKKGSRIVLVAGDLSKDLMDPSSWRISNSLTYPGTPRELVSGLFPYESQPGGGDHWLEPSVVNVGGRVRVIVRIRIDGYATSGMCAVCDATDDGKALALRFTQLHPMPGAQNNFHIIYDELTGCYWTPVNLPTSTQDPQFHERLKAMGFHGTPGNERRILVLLYSVDALNWFQACCVAMLPSPMQGLNYSSPLVDGDDMLFAVRTSMHGRNQHDNDLVTFHRLEDFRSLALDLRPRP